ncbi:hypothetical protein HMPREF1316_0678 [Olsenella profusa F0195]|uniref:Uncharacterized protein n=1 Tax=Olsenella profusa F0195 TaxID=1125712 RepID=U2V0P6_9ACTN|nr:hypothetical protein HMPREF1316_0678 [Olsenella profusa F0195]
MVPPADGVVPGGAASQKPSSYRGTLPRVSRVVLYPLCRPVLLREAAASRIHTCMRPSAARPTRRAPRAALVWEAELCGSGHRAVHDDATGHGDAPEYKALRGVRTWRVLPTISLVSSHVIMKRPAAHLRQGVRAPRARNAAELRRCPLMARQSVCLTILSAST